MKKYNLTKIMKRAWEIKKENNENLFAMCLKLAWEEAKMSNEKTIEEMIDAMTTQGTPKQDKYAKDLLKLAYQKLIENAGRYFNLKKEGHIELTNMLFKELVEIVPTFEKTNLIDYVLRMELDTKALLQFYCYAFTFQIGREKFETTLKRYLSTNTLGRREYRVNWKNEELRTRYTFFKF